MKFWKVFDKIYGKILNEIFEFFKWNLWKKFDENCEFLNEICQIFNKFVENF